MNCPYCGRGLKVILGVEIGKVPFGLDHWLEEIAEDREERRRVQTRKRVAKHRLKVRAMRAGLGIDCTGDRVNKSLGKP
jgi:hypothetical protein